MDGNGSIDTLFNLDANGTLTTATFFDYESNARLHSILVQAQDEYSTTLKKLFTVSLLDVYEPSLPNHYVDLNSSVNLEMIWVAPGTFTMGSPVTEANRDSDEIEHIVTFTKGFYLGKYEVTQAQYEAVMTGVVGDLNATPSFHGPNRPVVKVSWNDVQVFLQRLNNQQSSDLPKVKVMSYQPKPSGNMPAEQVHPQLFLGNTVTSLNANFNPESRQSVDVGQYNSNPWGFHDMHGVLYEWCFDFKSAYSVLSQVDPIGPSSGNSRVRRGGS